MKQKKNRQIDAEKNTVRNLVGVNCEVKCELWIETEQALKFYNFDLLLLYMLYKNRNGSK